MKDETHTYVKLFRTLTPETADDIGETVLVLPPGFAPPKTMTLTTQVTPEVGLYTCERFKLRRTRRDRLTGERHAIYVLHETWFEDECP